MSTTPSSSSLNYPTRHRIPNPNTSSLLVIDMQNHFISMATPILPALISTIDLCRTHAIPIIYTRHRHLSPADHGMLSEWWGNDLILENTPQANLLPDINPLPGDLVVEKSTYSAFAGTGLEETLRGMGVEEVIVTGVMTNLCCATTAMEAFVRGFRVFFSVDATATSSQELHEGTLNNMAFGFAYLVDCKMLKDGLGSDP